jgi:hypothetical protein
MNKSNVSFNEELDYDNKRLVYVNDITKLDTHSYEFKNTLSTDELVSTFDGGYQLSLVEQLEYYETNSRNSYEELLRRFKELEEKHYEINVRNDEINSLITTMKELIENHHSEVKNNLVKKFETSRYSNEKRVKDKNITERMYNFYDNLMRTHRTSL